MEIWKPLRNFPGYEGSNEGRIKNIRTQKTLKPNPTKRNRNQISLYKEHKPYTVKVDRTIAETFLGEQPGYDVRHRDGDSLNDRADNLYWSTRSETINDAFIRGSKLPSRGTSVRVIETGEIYKTVKDCARDTGCASSEIFKQLAGKRPHVKGYHFERV